MPQRTFLETLTGRVEDFFRKRADRYHLQPGSIEARYILNWGGFVNASFRITDGARSYHLKLANEDWTKGQLDHWRFFNKLLTEQYRAPILRDRVKIPRTGFEGLLFEFLPGRKVDLVQDNGVLQEILELLARLHADQSLADALRKGGETPQTCSDYFLDVYIDRFDEDLLSIVSNLPPFVSLETLSWMMGETRELEAIARETPEFDVPAAAPTHGDLWASNILVTPSGKWYIIDWDDFAFGDPVLDHSTLLGPLWLDGSLSEEAMMDLLPDEPAIRKRMAVYLRALLLDQVIDSLADWVEAEFAPDHLEEVRLVKERIHGEALEQYRRRYEVNPPAPLHFCV